MSGSRVWTEDDEALVTEAAEIAAKVSRMEARVEAIGRSFDAVYCGDVTFEVVDGPHAGWRLDVFNDCAEWDYISGVRAPDGRSAHWSEFSRYGRERFFDIVARAEPTTGEGEDHWCNAPVRPSSTPPGSLEPLP